MKTPVGVHWDLHARTHKHVQKGSCENECFHCGEQFFFKYTVASLKALGILFKHVFSDFRSWNVLPPLITFDRKTSTGRTRTAGVRIISDGLFFTLLINRVH